MEPIDFAAFEARARARGFDEVLERQWDPLTVIDTHAHAVGVHARVVQGEMGLSDASGTRHLRSGDSFDLDAECPHAERYGAQGATYWVARRNPA